MRFASNGVQNTTIYLDDFFLVKKEAAEVDDSELINNGGFEVELQAGPPTAPAAPWQA